MNLEKYDDEITTDDIIHFCEYINISIGEFSDLVDKHKNEEIWKKTSNGWELKFKINKKIINEN